MVVKRRIDQLMVDRGAAPSREKARALLMAGAVLVDEVAVVKPGALVHEHATIRLKAKPMYVSRGGLKLAGALKSFQVDVRDLVALDVGASTGGFTDCLIQDGVRRVYALDVGYGQLAQRIRSDERVVVLERVNARHPFDLPEFVDIVTIDVSFISLTKIIPSVKRKLSPAGRIIALVKPQFEAERKDVGRKGIIRDPGTHSRVLGDMVLWAVKNKLRVRGLIASPILGSEGNREFFLLLHAME